MTSRAKHATLILMTAVALTACGIKPGSLEPPQGKDKDQFPRTYPAQETIK